MALTEQIKASYLEILREELLPAMGCTEPIAIAYAAAILRDALGAEPARIDVSCSGNIIKNVKSVIVPATGGLHGIEAAVAAGVISASPARRLEVLSALTEADHERIASFCRECDIRVGELVTKYPFDLRLWGTCGKHTASVRIQQHHTNVTLAERDGEDITARYTSFSCSLGKARTGDRALLNVQDIVSFADEVTVDPELASLLKRQMDMNLAIAEEGLRHEYGACIGRLLYRDGAVDLRERAKAYAAAGSDARMSGCELPVCILSGSGNQGITASVPVMIYAKEWGCNEERLMRALLIADLITVHQKTGIGCLSAYCGAISAGCGCACGIAYLAGGGFYEIAHTLVNAVAILSGTICDGAKPSCAAKIAMAVDAGLLGYEMMRAGKQFYGGDGIITKGVENTIRNIGRLARDGMGETDREIIRIMLGKG